MTTAVFAAAIFCLLIVLGYQFNQSSGKLEQGSLLQFRSFPSDAKVSINGQAQNFTTPDKKNVAAGDHTVSMQREGYNEWSKSIHLRPGELMWLNYTRFVPKSVVTEEVKEFDALNSALASPNKKYFALQQTPSSRVFDIYSLEDEKKPKLETVTLAEGILPEKIQSSEIVDWNNGNKYFLVAYNKASAPEYVLIDRTDAKKAVNITKKFNIKIADIQFGEDGGNIFYARSQGDIRKIDLGSGTISEPLVSNAADFEVFKSDTIVFSAINDEKRVIGLHKNGDEKSRTVRTLQNAQPTAKVISGSYFGDDYVAFSNGSEVEIIKNPQDSKKVFASFILKAPVQWLQFSDNGRFIVAQHANELATYDLEYNKTQHITLEASKTPAKPVGWLDGYHLWDAYSGRISMIDFDGTNRQIITDALTGYDATLSSSGKRLFSIGQNKTTKKPVFQSSQMVIED
ncbi:PEGA domain-containing protein [Candidatus Saccharibacteria bacterium]|nr:PEGA domain-containing protein [Candidatus Saccharibacteria bacterium]